MSEQALSGLRVLDLGQHIAGPYCAKLLADHGAEVVKVETSGEGDPARRAGPFPGDQPDPEMSGLFHYLNANKKGITLNLKSDTGVMIFKRLAREADILVENLAPSVLPSLGLSYQVLEKVNPGLVMTSISPFGQAGPYRDYKANDLVHQALGGWMYSGGAPDREPLKAGGSLSDYVGGLAGAVATMTALYSRRLTGRGQHVDISVQEAMVSTNPYLLVAYSFLGIPFPRTGSPSPFPATILACQDGYIGINILTQGQWEMLCFFLGLPELAEDPRFQDGKGRQEHRQEITDILRPRLLERGREELFNQGQELRVPFCLVPTTEEVLHLSQHQARDYFIQVDQPGIGPFLQPGPPFKMGETPWQLRSRAPALGEHNRAVYQQYLGYGEEDLVRLREGGII